jgi:hypothetical protein
MRHGNGRRVSRGGWTSRTLTVIATSEDEAMRATYRLQGRQLMGGYFPVAATLGRLQSGYVLERAQATEPEARYYSVHMHRAGRRCATCAQKGAPR